MKVGTDGVLLGAWTDISFKPSSFLDIGAGTGLLSLMIAQRSNIELIDAIEIDDKAYEQCVQNFEESPWGDRLFCYHAGLDEFVAEIDEPYDLIISNPPFYSEIVSSGDEARDKARQNISLPFDELIESVAQLLSPSGSFSVVIPFKEEISFKNLARDKGLFPKRITRVKGTPESEIKRSLIEFTFHQYIYPTQELTIEKSRHQYTSEYIQLTRNFYLKM
ncbi:methyltransferase [Flavobacteriaceae bacterium R38]|nr:methyltransferase [Flavobacteriaceae bacterium R38]